MEFDDKTLALAKHLKVDPALISNDYSDYYTVNKRTVKEGKTPEEFKKLADDFKALLDEEHQELVTVAILAPHKKAVVEKDGVKHEKDYVDVVYAEVVDFLKPMKKRSEERRKQLERINAGEWKPPIKETPEDIYGRLDKEHIYVENILFHLIKDSHAPEYADSLRRGWLGMPISDTRKDRETFDGEYLVLTDSEADDWEEEGLRSLFQDMLPRDLGCLEKYIDEDAFVEDNRGNRGENINGYDGTEEEVEFEGTKYFIYRNN